MSYDTTFGLKYEVPESWEPSDESTDTDIYYYKGTSFSLEGMLYITYTELDGDILDEVNLSGFVDGLRSSTPDGYDDQFESHETSVSGIKAQRFSYLASEDNEEYKTDGVVFNCNSGIVVMLMLSTSLEDDNSAVFESILSRLAIEEASGTDGDSLKAEAESIIEQGVKDALESGGDTSEGEADGSAASVGTEEKNALSTAKRYLKHMAFSREGLIDQLEYEGYSEDAAIYAVDNCGADWMEQAALKAQEYLNHMSFSRSGLIDQLEYEGFTSEEAEYGVSAVGY